MSDQVAQAEAANELFEELLNGGEAGKAHEETPAGALLYAQVTKRLTGRVFWEAWEHFKGLTVAELHEEYAAMQDLPKPALKSYLVSRARGEA